MKHLLIFFTLVRAISAATQCNNATRGHVTLSQVCVPEGRTTTFTLPFASIGAQAYGSSYTYWYVMNDHLQTSGWDSVVVDPPGEDWSSYATASNATHQRKILKMTTSQSGFIVSVNLTRHNLTTNHAASNKGCWGFKIWLWKAGWDESFPAGARTSFQLCQIDKEETSQKPEVNSAGRIRGIVARVEPLTRNDWFRMYTGIIVNGNNWLIMAEQAAKQAKSDCVVCLGARPVLKIVPALMNVTCMVDLMTRENPSSECAAWDRVYPLTKADKRKPIFSADVATFNFTCINITGEGRRIGNNSNVRCAEVAQVNSTFNPISRSDVWWYCGTNQIYDSLPTNKTGLCALISLILPTTVISVTLEELLTSYEGSQWHQQVLHRQKRNTLHEPDPTYIDAIGVPRGVPDEYKLTDQVAGGFESTICWWCTINKNVDRINYIHYNVQRLGNLTLDGFSAVHEQLSATSMMAFQNRIALDMLLAEKGGVCSMFGEECCTFIPNNTASNGSLVKALHGLRSLNKKMKEHSGVDTTIWDNWLGIFGKYRALVSSILVSIAVFAAVLTLCGCCCIPCIRALVTRLIERAVSPMKSEYEQLQLLYEMQYTKLNQEDAKEYEGESEPEDYTDAFPQLYEVEEKV